MTCFQNWFTPFALQRSHGFATCSRGTGAFNLIQLLGLHSKSEKVGGMALRTYVGPSESTQVLNSFFLRFCNNNYPFRINSNILGFFGQCHSQMNLVCLTDSVWLRGCDSQQVSQVPGLNKLYPKYSTFQAQIQKPGLLLYYASLALQQILSSLLLLPVNKLLLLCSLLCCSPFHTPQLPPSKFTHNLANLLCI